MSHNLRVAKLISIFTELILHLKIVFEDKENEFRNKLEEQYNIKLYTVWESYYKLKNNDFSETVCILYVFIIRKFKILV
jgi:hypothetical protein